MDAPEDRSLIDLTVPAQAVAPGAVRDRRAVAQVTAEAPAAVLVVDLALRAVVHANRVAEQLAPGLALPVAVEDWSDAAALRDVDGEPLSETDHPLTRVARSEPVAGQAVSAARATEMGSRRDPLWVVALPMVDAPLLTGHALVVFLPVHQRDRARAAADAATADSAAGAELREAAVLATGLSFTVADARAPDLPLVWVNPAFTAVTGYSFADSVGRNCRFLQGPGTDPAARAAMGQALEAGRDVTVVLLNYREDGTAFWNQLAMSPIHDAAGALTHFVGIQTDVTARVAADGERDAALAAERAARSDAEAAHARLHLLAEVSSQLSGTLDAEQAVARLAELVVPVLGDFSMVSLLSDAASTDPAHALDGAGTRTPRAGGEAHRDLRDVAWWHRDEGRRAQLAELARHRLTALTDASGVSRAQRSGAPAVLNTGAAAATRAVMAAGRASELIGELAPEAVAVFPLRGRGRTVGVLTVWRSREHGAFTAEEVALGEDLAARAGLALDSARLYRQQRDLAAGLQRSLLTLTAAPDPERVQVVVRYVAAAEAAQVGGDWYDTHRQPGGATVVVIGDVIGHDTEAAAAMAQVRSLVRALGAVADDGPAAVLTKTDQVLATLRVATTATALVARLEEDDPDAATTTLTWSNAGHPPAVVVRPDGSVAALDVDEPDLLLGIDPGTARQESRVVLERGTTVLLHTDGLVERRGQSLDEGLERLRVVLAELVAQGAGLDELADRVLAAMLPARPEDDVALVAVRLRP